MADVITCPSGLQGRVRGMKVREERVLADRKLAKNGGQVDELLAACWEETIDPGPYAPAAADALLAVEHRPGRIQLDRHRHRQQQRRQQQQPQPGGQQVDGAFGHHRFKRESSATRSSPIRTATAPRMAASVPAFNG